MQQLHDFCWLDLAARDAEQARRFYAQAFGWQYDTGHVNGGVYTRCRVGDHAIGSLYQLRRAQLEHGVPSHWTPYLRVADVDAAAQRVAWLGGRALVSPFDVAGVARIALIEDAVGALVGLWQAAPAAQSAAPARSGCSRVVGCDDQRDDDELPVRAL